MSFSKGRDPRKRDREAKVVPSLSHAHSKSYLGRSQPGEVREATVSEKEKKVILELEFMRREGDPVSPLRAIGIPKAGSGSRGDLSVIDLRLWGMTKTDLELKRAMAEQERIYFNSKLGFKFLGEYLGT